MSAVDDVLVGLDKQRRVAWATYYAEKERRVALETVLSEVTGALLNIIAEHHYGWWNRPDSDPHGEGVAGHDAALAYAAEALCVIAASDPTLDQPTAQRVRYWMRPALDFRQQVADLSSASYGR